MEAFIHVLFIIFPILSSCVFFFKYFKMKCTVTHRNTVCETKYKESLNLHESTSFP